jgi:hypothetical protein
LIVTDMEEVAVLPAVSETVTEKLSGPVVALGVAPETTPPPEVVAPVDRAKLAAIRLAPPEARVHEYTPLPPLANEAKLWL